MNRIEELQERIKKLEESLDMQIMLLKGIYISMINEAKYEIYKIKEKGEQE